MSDEYIRKADTVEETLKYIISSGVSNQSTWNECVRTIADTLQDMRPADVAPVKYGEWISTPEMWGAFDVRYYCSKCGKDAIINNSERYVLSDYCPHCGAIMDNKRGNENG